MKQKVHRFLRWSEKYTKTDMLYLAEGGFWLTAAKVIGIATSFATSVAFANILPEETYGIYRYVLSGMALLVIPTLSGIDTALIRSVSKGHESMFFKAFGTRVRYGVIGSLGGVSVSTYYFLNGNETLGLSFLLAALFVPIMDPPNVYIAYLTGKKRFKQITLYQFIIRTLSTICLVGTIFITDNVAHILFVYFFAYSIFRLLFFLHVRKVVPRDKEPDNEMVPFGVHISLQDLPSLFSKTIDSILLFHFFGGAMLAGYAIAHFPLQQTQNLLRSINILALPSLSKRSTSEIRATLPAKIIKYYTIIFIAITLYWVLAQYFFQILYSQYVDFVFISQLFMLQLLALPISLFHTALTAYGAKKRLYIHSISISTLRVLLLLILIPKFGAYGAVYALLVTTFIGSILITLLFTTYKYRPFQ